MKNMKKILAVGALLTLGTMAMGKAEKEFNIKLDIVKPLEITADETFDFGSVAEADFTSRELTNDLKIKGTTDVDINFAVTGDKFLTDVNGGSGKVPFTAQVQNSNGTNLTDTIVDLGDNGEFTGKFAIALDAEGEEANIVEGNYEGKVLLTVDYN